MKIGVISDTHIVTGGLGFRKVTNQLFYKNKPQMKYLKEIVEKHFKDVRLIIHAGDLAEEEVLDLLEETAPVEAVFGNMDHGEISKRLPARKVLTLEGRRIGLVHGWGAPAGIVERVRKEFNDVEAIIFGHTHSPMNSMQGGVLFFNPGSPTDKRFAPFNSIGLLHVDAEKIGGEIIRL